MKHRRIILLLACILLIGNTAVMAASVDDFNDVHKNDWYYESVAQVVSEGLFVGVNNSEFSPNSYMTRAMLVTVLGRYHQSNSYFHKGDDITGTSGVAFTDVSSSAYYAKYVAWASANGIVEGTGGNKFSPNENIKRQDVVKMLYFYYKYIGLDMSYSDSKYATFTDTDQVSDYAIIPMKWATSKGIINGYSGKIDPRGILTRAQAAQMFANLINLKLVKASPLFSIDASAISSIEFHDLTTGLLYNLDTKSDMQGIINILNAVEYLDGITPEQTTGWVYRFRLSGGDPKVTTEVVIRSASVIEVDGRLYRSVKKIDFKTVSENLLSKVETFSNVAFNIPVESVSKIMIRGELIEDAETIEEIVNLINTFEFDEVVTGTYIGGDLSVRIYTSLEEPINYGIKPTVITVGEKNFLNTNEDHFEELFNKFY